MRSGSDHRLSVAGGEDLVSPADETMNNDGPFPIAFILGAFRAMWWQWCVCECVWSLVCCIAPQTRCLEGSETVHWFHVSSVLITRGSCAVRRDVDA